MAEKQDRFYIRYYVGHKGKFGHEFLEFEFRPDGKLRYANNSNYKNDTMIRKEAYVSPSCLSELRRIVDDAEIMKENDALWPAPDRVGRQELEILIGDEHISFTEWFEFLFFQRRMFRFFIEHLFQTVFLWLPKSEVY